MTIEQLRLVHQARPFRPFTMHMADGKTIHISHPECLAYSPSGRSVLVALPDDSGHFIDLLMVVRLEVRDGSARRKGHRSR